MKQAQKHIVLLNGKTIIELDFAKYRDLSVSRRSIICLCLRHRQIIDLLATDKSRYFAQPRPIIVYYYAGDKLLMNKFIRKKYRWRSYVKRLYILNVWEPIPLKRNIELGEW